MHGAKKGWDLEALHHACTLDDYTGVPARWCPGCGDHGVLTAVQRVARDLELPPEKTVVVSGIGCSSRFPHYMKTYGFHGLHGRPLPIACGVKSRRPDLDVFVVTGDGDCCAIGTAHWIHALRYNMNLTILMLDNNIYGLTKMQTSPTTHRGERSNTHPHGSFFVELNPIAVNLGISNISFVAQTIDWNPPHLYETIKRAHAHPGAAFVRIFQRCPHYTSHVFAAAQSDPTKVRVLVHPNGIPLDPMVARLYSNQVEHDPSDMAHARELADRTEAFTIGLFYQNTERPRYDDVTSVGVGMSLQDKLAGLQKTLDRFDI
ncbi:MAG: thiamine pyrophosphate-dependent enzyme [Bryobacterales bacterium]